MNAAIIAIGSEMLGIGRLDTNSLTITRLLERYGVTLRRKSVVGDDRADLAAELRFAASQVDAIFVCGGLGPTEDDLTKEVVAEVFGLSMELDESVLDAIRLRFQKRGIEMPEVNRKQAMVFPGQETVPNALGTAPAFHLKVSGKRECDLWLFPGVPHELEGLLNTAVEPWLRAVSSESMLRRVLKVTGLSESHLEEMIAPYYAKHPGDTPTVLAGNGELQIHIVVPSSRGEAVLAERTRELAGLIGSSVYGYDDDTLEGVVGAALLRRNETVAVAESCTGGLLGSRITDVSGSSAWFLGGAICYTREAKLFLVGVDPAAIDEHGEVSEEVARQMARGAKRRFGATYGVGITGIAGPTGGTPAKPVGTVHVAVATPGGVEHRKLQLPGTRPLVKRWSTQAALDLLRRQMEAER